MLIFCESIFKGIYKYYCFNAVYVFPYILAFTRNTIEIRLVVNGTLVHTLVLPKVYLISAKVSHTFVNY